MRIGICGVVSPYIDGLDVRIDDLVKSLRCKSEMTVRNHTLRHLNSPLACISDLACTLFERPVLFDPGIWLGTPIDYYACEVIENGKRQKDAESFVKLAMREFSQIILVAGASKYNNLLARFLHDLSVPYRKVTLGEVEATIFSNSSVAV